MKKIKPQFIKALVIPRSDTECGHEIICNEKGNNCYCPICCEKLKGD